MFGLFSIMIALQLVSYNSNLRLQNREIVEIGEPFSNRHKELSYT